MDGQRSAANEIGEIGGLLVLASVEKVSVMFLPRVRRVVVFVLVGFTMTQTAHAGMTMPGFTDIARARFQVISFFFVLYLAMALIYRWAWNSLARDFVKLPRISYRGALAALAVCGLFIYVVLTMISGARELMTPGAWARIGVSYRLREPEKDPKAWLDTARRDSLERLRGALWQYASRHGGEFPLSREQMDIPAGDWKSIDPDGLPLAYVPGLKADAGRDVLAFEPVSFGPTRFVLFSNGEIAPMPAAELVKRMQDHIKDLDIKTAKSSGP
jgi:hypothetical protein